MWVLGVSGLRGFLGLIVDKSEPDLDLFKLLLPRDFFLIGDKK